MLTPYGEWVRAFRTERKITLREMARTLGRSPSFLSAIELGRKSAPESLAKEISVEFSLSDEELNELERRISHSRSEAKIRFSKNTDRRESEVAMLFARNFNDLTEDQTERIRKILEEKDGRIRR